jgi:hypothetical protein
MAMRSECRHYESRTYATGEVVRKCRLDAAPEAPWRCPDDCAVFEVRRMDVGWQYGSLASTPKVEPAPVAPNDSNVSALLDEAEDIINTAAPGIIADFEPRKKRRLGKKKKKK